MSVDERFIAACKVIAGLPKNGPFEPSNDLKLTFYAYHKQATKGPCNIPKPRWWDIIGCAKWDAWNRLGNMPRDEAKAKYVERLESIVETMSFNKDIESFLGAGSSNIDTNDLEMALGPMMQKLQPEPTLSSDRGFDLTSKKDELPVTENWKDNETDDEEYCDPMYVMDYSKPAEMLDVSWDHTNVGVQNLQLDLAVATERISKIEECNLMLKDCLKKMQSAIPKPVQLRNFHPLTLMFFLTWPIVINLIFKYFAQRRFKN